MRRIQLCRRALQARNCDRATCDDWDLDCLDALEEAADSITIIDTPEIENAVDRFIGYIPLVLNPERFEVSLSEVRQGIFDSHRTFIDAVRRYFHKPPKTYKSVPIVKRPNRLDPKSGNGD
ncbi:hypothetical protein OKHIL_65670 [Mycolicibacterium mageritense]|nr:hypothetical protein MTY414_74490 [Mycolicibacterium mageritense]